MRQTEIICFKDKLDCSQDKSCMNRKNRYSAKVIDKRQIDMRNNNNFFMAILSQSPLCLPHNKSYCNYSFLILMNPFLLLTHFFCLPLTTSRQNTFLLRGRLNCVALINTCYLLWGKRSDFG